MRVTARNLCISGAVRGFFHAFNLVMFPWLQLAFHFCLYRSFVRGTLVMSPRIAQAGTSTKQTISCQVAMIDKTNTAAAQAWCVYSGNSCSSLLCRCCT